MNTMSVDEFCIRHNACVPGFRWAVANCATMQEVWDTAKPEWLVWVATRPGVVVTEALDVLLEKIERDFPNFVSAAMARGAKGSRAVIASVSRHVWPDVLREWAAWIRENVTPNFRRPSEDYSYLPAEQRRYIDYDRGSFADPLRFSFRDRMRPISSMEEGRAYICPDPLSGTSRSFEATATVPLSLPDYHLSTESILELTRESQNDIAFPSCQEIYESSRSWLDESVQILARDAEERQAEEAAFTAYEIRLARENAVKSSEALVTLVAFFVWLSVFVSICVFVWRSSPPHVDVVGFLAIVGWYTLGCVAIVGNPGEWQRKAGDRLADWVYRSLFQPTEETGPK